jgi:sialic acid synthase SpsE
VRESASRVFRRSLFAVENIKRGEAFTSKNVRSIRPGNGLHTRHLPEILGHHASRDIEKGTPLDWALIS